MGRVFSTQSRPDTDVLGDEGRKVLNACVKVKIFGKPETREYDSRRAQQLFRECYLHQMGVECHEFPQANDGMEKTYSVVDIYNTMDKYEKMPYVQIYPKEGSGSEKTRELIDKRRAEVKRELEEAKANPDRKKTYSWIVAQRRVRDCYAGNFPEDIIIPPYHHEPFSIKVIKDIVAGFENESIEIFSNQTKITDEKVLAHRATIQKEYQKALDSPGTLYKYSEEEALESFKKCYSSPVPLDNGYGNHDCYTCKLKDFCIFKLYKKVCREDNRVLKLCKYPGEGPGSKELRESIERHRADLQKEYQNFCDHEESQIPDRKYSHEEAVRRVRDCFAGGFRHDSDVFPIKKDETGMPKIYQTYDIFDIKQSLEYFDSKKFLEKYPEKGHISDEIKKRIDEQRAHILSEHEIADAHSEIEHGSGFVISNHFILTNKHVIETCLNKKGFEICISNAAIGKLHCEVAHSDPGKDLALLYCSALNLPQCRISPVQLSTQPLLPGMQIFSFGYPISHTEETALFVTGNVSGSKRNPSGHSMAVLNCALNSGNSGGPVLSWVDGQVKVVGIATQKHFKEILTFDEIETIENIRKSLQTQSITDVSECELEDLAHQGNIVPGSIQVSINLLTLKLYDALETHSQFNLSNALPGDSVVEFIKNSILKYKGEHKEELVKVIELCQ